ncbi:MAG: molybdopterin molybdotransferase MoeA [Terrimicrobiaceae bacterium]|nr:molybdopterin molybdotransferase MoeA [Terrimicrobiaceae bacterium]
MMSVDEVWDVIDRDVPSLPPARVPLADAGILRENILAPRDMPSFDRSAMDGYLARMDELPGARLHVGRAVFPGEPPRSPEPGMAIRISTGAPIPDGAFGIVKREDALRHEDGTIVLGTAPSAGWIRRSGSQARAGSLLLPAGTRLEPASTALLASAGIGSVLASPIPAVGHIATGSEIARPGEPLRPWSIPDANSPMVAALLSKQGARLESWHLIPEDARILAELLRRDLPLQIISGGAGPGEADVTLRSLREAGFEPLVTGVAVRPGKPFLLARRGRSIAVGLPGNPLSHFVCFQLFVRRVLDRLFGARSANLVEVPVPASRRPPADERETWWPSQWKIHADGFSIERLPWCDSSDLTHLHRANALLRVPAGGLTTPAAEAMFL